MESAAIEYNTERKCDIIKIGNVFENRGYGIAMPRSNIISLQYFFIFLYLYKNHFFCISSTDSPYRTSIDQAILKLKEKGILQNLKIKWWRNKGGGLCKKDEMEKNTSTYESGMVSLGGAFFILICGCSASFFVAICEFLWNIRKVAVTEKVNLHFTLFIILIL